MNHVKLQTLNGKGLLLFAVIYAAAFLSFWLYSSEDVWMFFCCLLSYGAQVICIGFFKYCMKCVDVTTDNIASYIQKENIYKIIYVLLIAITIFLDAFPFVAMSGAGNIPEYERGVLVSFMTLGTGYIPEYEGGVLVGLMTVGIWCIWGLCICGVVFLINLQKEYDSHIAYAEEEKTMLEQQRLEKERIEAEYNSMWQELSNKYGECTIDVCIGANTKEIKQHIYVFENSATIVLNGEGIAFNKILGFTLQDESKTIMTSNMASYTSTTKTSTGSMIGRAVVGGMLTGGLGAVAGAATAKKETITTPNQGKSTTTTSIKHNYICYVNVNDLANPIREIYLGEDSKMAQTVANIFNVIIERNK